MVLFHLLLVWRRLSSVFSKIVFIDLAITSRQEKEHSPLFLRRVLHDRTYVLTNKIKAEGLFPPSPQFSVISSLLPRPPPPRVLIFNLVIAVHHYHNASCSILGIVLSCQEVEGLESFWGETQCWISRCSWPVCHIS